MYNGNGRPLSNKKTVQLMVILTILAWATQTLLHQWGFSQTIGEEKFMTDDSHGGAPATLELRAEATIVGSEVKLKQVCRWSDADANVFAPIADLVLARLGDGSPYRALSSAEIKSTLRDAGVNLASINFAGTTSCTVNRSDIQVNETDALQKWLDAQSAKREQQEDAVAAPAQPAPEYPSPATQPVLASSTIPAEPKPFHSLRELIAQDLATRLNLPIEQLQMTFRQQDERILNLAEPLFKFQLDATRARDLGEVSWNITLFADGHGTQRATVSATARAWQDQLIIAKPLAFKQVIRKEDVIERRALIDRLNDDVVLDKSQSIGQQAARDLKPGQILTARLVDAIELVRVGQFVTVIYRQGGVELKSVARAMESGSFGQTIRVKNEATRDVFEVLITGPQTASMTAIPAHEVEDGAVTAAAKQ